MALVPVTVSGILKSANGALLTGKTIEYTALGVYGDAGVLVPPVKVTTVTHATTAAFSSVLLTSDAADAFVRFQVKFHTGSKKKFDLTDDDLTADLDDLINTYDGASSSSAAALAVLLAAKLPIISVLRSYLATTVTYNNTAALADTALSVTVAASGIYDIELVVHSTAAAANLSMDFGGTATVTNFIGQWSGWDTALAFPNGLRVTTPASDFDLPTGFPDSYYSFKGTIEVNAGGTFLLRGAQNAADVSNTTILRGSTLKLMKLN